MEQFQIALYDSTNPDKGYNHSYGGENNAGFHHTIEWKKQTSERMLGENNHFYGKHHSIETRNILSELKRKKVVCLETMETFDSMTEAGEKYNRTRQAIAYAIKHKTKCAGYHWEYRIEQNIENN